MNIYAYRIDKVHKPDDEKIRVNGWWIVPKFSYFDKYFVSINIDNQTFKCIFFAIFALL